MTRRLLGTWAAFWLASSAGSATAQQDHDRQIGGVVRLGTEYDENVFRDPGGPDSREGGFLTRYFTALDLATRAVGPSVATLSASHGGKFFFANEHGAADVLLTQLGLGYRHRLVKPLSAWLSADLKDRTERVSERDYTLGGAGGGLDLTTGPVTTRVGVAQRFFSFKPSSDYSSANSELLTFVRWEGTERIDLFTGYQLARRQFRAARYVDEDGDEFPELVPGEQRSDTLHVGSIGAAYRGPVVAELRYTYVSNVSNSYDNDLTRHSLDVTFTAPLPGRLFASLHGELRSSNAVPFVSPEGPPEEDFGNSAVVSLVRTFGENWEIEGRYSIYVSEFNAEEEYRRQLALLAVGYVFD